MFISSRSKTYLSLPGSPFLLVFLQWARLPVDVVALPRSRFRDTCGRETAWPGHNRPAPGPQRDGGFTCARKDGGEGDGGEGDGESAANGGEVPRRPD